MISSLPELQPTFVSVQEGRSQGPKPGSKHHLHRKKAGLFCELKKALAFLISQGRTCNVFLTKMNDLLPDTK